MDHDLKTRPEELDNLCLDDILCEDRQYELRRRLLDAIESCDYTLSKGVSSFKMLLRVDKVRMHDSTINILICISDSTPPSSLCHSLIDWKKSRHCKVR